MKKIVSIIVLNIIILAGSLMLTGCGGGGEDLCETETWRQRVTDSTGTYWVRCKSFQCPGFNREISCVKE